MGAVWDPSVRTPRPFKTLSRFSSAPQTTDGGKDKDVVVLNKRAIIDEIKRLGRGLVKEIRMKSSAG
jgi:U3 small nucleolar RNA-associated protein 22